MVARARHVEDHSGRLGGFHTLRLASRSPHYKDALVVLHSNGLGQPRRVLRDGGTALPSDGGCVRNGFSLDGCGARSSIRIARFFRTW
jgi:hypothetical protein